MKVKILSDFRDKYDYSRLYKAGDVVTLNEERANELITLGLVEPLNNKEEAIEEEKEEAIEEEKEEAIEEEKEEAIEEEKEEAIGKGRKTKDA